MTILKLMIVRRVTGYFFFAQVSLANIYPFLGQNVAKIIGNCEPGRRLVEAPLQPLPYLVLSLHRPTLPISYEPKAQREKTTKIERKI